MHRLRWPQRWLMCPDSSGEIRALISLLMIVAEASTALTAASMYIEFQ